MLRCAITDGSASGFVNATQIERLQNQVRRWAADGIDLIQLREKNLDAGALLALAEAALQTLREMQSPTEAADQHARRRRHRRPRARRTPHL